MPHLSSQPLNPLTIRHQTPLPLCLIPPARTLSAPLPPLLVDQGTRDKFLTDQLRPELLQDACAAAGQPLTLRRHEGYDHGYYFVSTFMEDHLRHHAQALNT